MTVQLKNPIPDFWDGYVIAPEVEEFPDNTPYRITGPRTNWLLCRNQVNPDLLFPISASGKCGNIKGYGWFKETIEGDVVTLTPVK